MDKKNILWRHSLSVGFGSRIIGNRTTLQPADDAFAAVLLHDMMHHMEYGAMEFLSINEKDLKHIMDEMVELVEIVVEAVMKI